VVKVVDCTLTTAFFIGSAAVAPLSHKNNLPPLPLCSQAKKHLLPKWLTYAPVKAPSRMEINRMFR